MSRASRAPAAGLLLLLASAAAFAACSDERGTGDATKIEAIPSGALQQRALLAEALPALAPWSSLPALRARAELRRDGDAFVVEAKASSGAARTSARLELPAVAGDAFRLEDTRSGVVARVRPLEARPIAGEAVEGKVFYRDAIAPGAHLVHAPLPAGTEELVVVERGGTAPAGHLAWELELAGNAAGLRLVGGALEIVDAGGAPRLRMARPWVADAAGARRWASTSIEGCAYDDSPAPPWGRPPRAPGATRCTVHVRWSPQGLSLPLLVDPMWTLATAMGTPRGHHEATLLQDGRVLVTGGADTGFGPDAAYASAELYDPNIDSWAVTGDMATGRREHVAARLVDGRVLVAGGRSLFDSGGLASAELYDPANGTFAPAGSMGGGRAAACANVLPSGKVLVTGGLSAGGTVVATAQAYDPATDAWSPAGSFPDARAHHTATTLTDGRVLVVGGHQDVASSSDNYPATSAIYDETVGGWQPAADAPIGRGWHTATLLADGRVAVVGGYLPPLWLKSAQLYAPGSNAWSMAPDLPTGREEHSATLLPNGSVLVAGGTVLSLQPGVGITTTETTLLTPDAAAWNAGDPMAVGRYRATATSLADGRVLIAGGFDTDFFQDVAVDDVAIYGLLADGTDCSVDDTCNSGMCRDGVCCDDDCASTCMSCLAVSKGSGDDGVCGPVAAGSDPQDECLDGGAAACMQNGLCDGAGACQLYAEGCAAKPCADGDECQSGVCSVDGICCDKACDGVCESCNGTVNGTTDGKCLPVLHGTDPDHECPSESDSDCSAINLCNGASACEPAVALCEPYVCFDDTACRTDCEDDAGCVSTHRCDDGACVVRAAGCQGSVAVTPDGDEIECSPYLCQADGSCRTSCGSAADCAEGFVCSGSGTCVTLDEGGDTGDDDDGGCGCRQAGTPPTSSLPAAGLLAAAILFRRRRGCRRGASRVNIAPGAKSS